MKKKILCVIISAVMVVGALAGCGSSSDSSSSSSSSSDSSSSSGSSSSTADNNGGSSKVEQTILTELIPGETTAEETKKWFQDNGLAIETDYDWQPAFADNEIPYLSKSSDTFLGYKCFYVQFDYVGTNGQEYDYEKGLEDKTLTNYIVYITFKDRDDYKVGKEKIEEYIQSLSETKAVHEGRTSGVKDWTLIKDKDKYATMISLEVDDLTWASNNYCKGLDMSDCFDTVLALNYGVDKGTFSNWELPDGTKFDLKCKDFVQSNK